MLIKDWYTKRKALITAERKMGIRYYKNFSIESLKAKESDARAILYKYIRMLAISAVKANTPTPVSGSFDQPSVGTCPKCGKKVFDTPKAYSCSGGRDGCGFIIWKTIAGKSISSTQAEKLISSGRTGLIKGFKAKSGNDFDAYLVLRDDKTIGFEFPKRKKK